MLAERAREHIASKNIDHSGNLPFHRVTLSMGLMLLDPEITYVCEEIYKYADEALYRAKAHGRNKVAVVDSTTDDSELF
jgi:diguanylate cyclase (GGDEF)-like protein